MVLTIRLVAFFFSFSSSRALTLLSFMIMFFLVDFVLLDALELWSWVRICCLMFSWYCFLAAVLMASIEMHGVLRLLLAYGLLRCVSGTLSAPVLFVYTSLELISLWCVAVALGCLSMFDILLESK